MQQERTAAWWIHHKYYRCMIRNADIAAREEDKYGYRRAGVSDMDDQEYAMQLSPVRLTIMEIANLWDDGGLIQLNNPRDAVEICTKVQEHLDTWNLALEERLTLPGTKGDVDKVLGDLVKLDGVQYHFHKMAMRYFGENVPRMRLEKHLAGRRRNGLNLNRVEQARHRDGDEAKQDDKSYHPIADSLKLKVLKRRKKGWQ